VGRTTFLRGRVGRTIVRKALTARIAMSGKMPYNIIYGMPGTGRKEQDYERKNQP
jgi:hypothetical protein